MGITKRRASLSRHTSSPVEVSTVKSVETFTKVTGQVKGFSTFMMRGKLSPAWTLEGTSREIRNGSPLPIERHLRAEFSTSGMALTKASMQ